MYTGGHDSDFEHDMKAESEFIVSGVTTPSGASYMPQVLDPEEEVKILYTWGDRDVASENLSSARVQEYLREATNVSSTAQPVEKYDEPNFWIESFEARSDNDGDQYMTGLPNPGKLRVDGEIEAAVSYQNGLLSLWLDFDTEYLHEDADEAIQHGNVRIPYLEKFAEDADSEFERTRRALDKLDKLESFLEE